jgi:predicted secreted hydrolase
MAGVVRRCLVICALTLTVAAAAVATMASQDEAGAWLQACTPRTWSFPKDHGAHPACKTEWWYFTGNLTDDAGRPFGYELTFFRHGVRFVPGPRANTWSLRDVYLAHFTVTDATAGRFFFDERASRKGPGLAGAAADRLDVKLLGWSARMEGGAIRLHARSDRMALDLRLAFDKPPVINGEAGISRKGPLPGQASYYASCTTLSTAGSVSLDHGHARAVRGVSWFDHEFGSNQLSAAQAGWDWFGLHLSDGRDLMVYLLRRKDGAVEPASSGTVVDAGGRSRHIPLSDVKVDVLGRWKSPKSGATYPAKWRLRIASEGIDLTFAPLLTDQELVTTGSTGVTYWEGAAQGSGTSGGTPITCLGYVELVGYAE